MADHVLKRTGIVAALLVCATACGSGGQGTSSRSAPGASGSTGAGARSTMAACDLFSETMAKTVLGLTVGLTKDDGGDSCKYLIPGTEYRDIEWTLLTTKYRSVSEAVTAGRALFTSATWMPAESPSGLGSGAQLLSGHSNGHDSQGIAVQVDEFILAWASPDGAVQAIVTSEPAEDASKDRTVSVASAIYGGGNGSSATTSVSVTPTSSDDASGGQWALTGSCPDASSLSSALGYSVTSVTPQDGVACQYHAVDRDLGLDLYTADSLSEERLTLDAAHGGIENLSSLGPDVQQAYGNGNFFNTCSVSAPSGADGGAVVAEAKDASMKPLDGKVLCPAVMALFTEGAHQAS